VPSLQNRNRFCPDPRPSGSLSRNYTGYPPTLIFGITEISLVTLRTDLSGLSQGFREREYPSTTGEADPRTYIKVLPGVDHVRRFHMWEQNEDDECVWEAMSAAGVYRSCDL